MSVFAATASLCTRMVSYCTNHMHEQVFCVTFQVLQPLAARTECTVSNEPIGSLHISFAMHDYLLCFTRFSNPRGPLEGTYHTCQQDGVIVDYCYTLDLLRPARHVKQKTPPTAQQMDKTGLECQMLILLSTWLLDLSTVVVPNWPMQHTASKTRILTGIGIYIYIYIYIYSHSSPLYGMSVLVCTCVRKQMRVYVYAHVHTYTHTHACTHVHTHAHTYTHTCTHTYTHMHTHTYAHTCMHTHIYMME